MKKPPGSAVTIKDIAQKLGLSHGSVSRALRNVPGIAIATRERVQAVANKMGYHPNPMATGLALFKRSSKIIPARAALAWLNTWPNPKTLRSFQEFDLYWQGASKAAENFGYHLEEFVVTRDMPLSRIHTILRARGINGILVPPHGGQKVDWDALQWEHFSAVRFGRSLEGLPFHSVTADQVANGTLAFQKIREHGYKRIGYVGDKTAQRVFVAGYLQAQLEVPKSSRLPPLLFAIPGSSENPKRFAAWLEKNQPDAIFTETPQLRKWLEEGGHRVPENIGLAGTNILDIDVDAGIHQQPEEIGRVAVLVLISLINDNDHGTPPIQRSILVKGEWVDGSSLPPLGVNKSSGRSQK